MYNFLEEYVCKNVSDITVMCRKRDFYRLYNKPTYEGDFLTQIFDWNINPEALDHEKNIIHKDVNKHELPKEEEVGVETWKSFNKNILKKARYKAKHMSRAWKKERTARMVEFYRDSDKKEVGGEIVEVTKE